MKAVVKEGPGPGFALKEMPRPGVQPGGVIVQVEAVGICGTDIPIFDGIRAVPPGLIPGHEFAGVIVEVGSGVGGWPCGGRVAVSMVKGCGRCRFCRAGEEPMCDQLTELGIHVSGAYAEFVAVPDSCLHRLPDSLSFEQGAAVDPIASSYRGIRKVAVDVEDAVVIFGAGPIALYALQAIKARGVPLVIVVGRSRAPLEAAIQLGADRVFSTLDGGPAAQVAAWTGGRMASVVIEATGNASLLPDVLDCAAKGARVVLLGIFHDEVMLAPAPIVRRELQVVGSFCYSWEDFEESLMLLAQGRITTQHIVTHVLPLDQVEEALRVIRERRAIKVVLRP